MANFRRHERDTGSVSLQIAMLTQRVKELTQHLEGHCQDAHSRQGLLQMVSKRRRLLAYLAKENQEAYTKLIAQLGLRR